MLTSLKIRQEIFIDSGAYSQKNVNFLRSKTERGAAADEYRILSQILLLFMHFQCHHMPMQWTPNITTHLSFGLLTADYITNAYVVMKRPINTKITK